MELVNTDEMLICESRVCIIHVKYTSSIAPRSRYGTNTSWYKIRSKQIW